MTGKLGWGAASLTAQGSEIECGSDLKARHPGTRGLEPGAERLSLKETKGVRPQRVSRGGVRAPAGPGPVRAHREG